LDGNPARLSVFSLVFSGISFVLFPVARPFFDESSLEGAVQFASTRWVIAHALGMAGFILLGLGLLGLYLFMRETPSRRRMFWAVGSGWIGIGLTLPFFGAEAFSLQVIGQAVTARHDPTLIPLVNEVRFGPGIVFIGTGLVLVAASTILLALAVWKSVEIKPKWSGLPLAIAFAVYIPQLQGDPSFQPIRILIGLVILIGCALLSRGVTRASRNHQQTMPRASN